MADPELTLLHGDCVEVMGAMAPDSVDAVVCDPPYGLEFMGKEWDRFSPNQPTLRSGSDHAGSSFAGIDKFVIGDNAPSQLPTYGKRRTTARCKSCGKRDAFKNPHACGAGEWVIEFVDAAPLEMQAFGEWCRTWALAALRVLKPGGHLVSFGGTRTYHRLACALEDAGFELRDSLLWLYGQGFPKSRDIGKAIDKEAGAEREVSRPGAKYESAPDGSVYNHGLNANFQQRQLTAPATAAAREWAGWGTALKPSYEPIVLARKPLSENTVAANVLRWGTGALNVDGCRIGTGTGDSRDGEATAETRYTERGSVTFAAKPGPRGGDAKGRWPANVVLSHTADCEVVGTAPDRHVKNVRPVADAAKHSEGWGTAPMETAEVEEEREVWACVEGCPVRLLDKQSGRLQSGTGAVKRRASATRDGNRSAAFGKENRAEGTPNVEYGDAGGASRFFYCAKASRAERERGLDALPTHTSEELSGGGGTAHPLAGAYQSRKPEGMHNTHPTVKPVAVMRWLIRLVAPPGGVVLDPFVGSGTTLVAAREEGMAAVGIERDAGYVLIASARAGVESPVSPEDAPTPVSEVDRTLNPYKTARCNVCGSKTKSPGQSSPGPNCGHGDWSWVGQVGGARAPAGILVGAPPPQEDVDPYMS